MFFSFPHISIDAKVGCASGRCSPRLLDNVLIISRTHGHLCAR